MVVYPVGVVLVDEVHHFLLGEVVYFYGVVQVLSHKQTLLLARLLTEFLEYAVEVTFKIIVFEVQLKPVLQVIFTEVLSTQIYAHSSSLVLHLFPSSSFFVL